MAAKEQELWGKSSTNERNDSKNASFCIFINVLTQRKTKYSNSGLCFLGRIPYFIHYMGRSRLPSSPSAELKPGREGIFPPQQSNSGLQYCQLGSLTMSHQGSPNGTICFYQINSSFLPAKSLELCPIHYYSRKQPSSLNNNGGKH